MKRLEKKQYKKVIMALSLAALILWSALGTGASLAWFSDSSPDITNIFHLAEFDLVLSHRLTDGTWEEVDEDTKVFDENALYEPGYVQVVYLRAENKGTVAFDFKAAVNVNGYTLAENVFGQKFNLQDHLKFGLTISDSETEMKDSIPDREAAKSIATLPLHRYSSDTVTIPAGGSAYVALVVRMPEEVGNIANYRKSDIPTVELGVTVSADQIRP